MAAGKLSRSLLGCALFIALWALAAGAGSPLLPSPAAVLEALARLAGDGRLASDVGASMSRVAAGVAVALLIATLLCGVALVSPAVSDLLSGPLEMLRPVPPIAWVPVVIMTFGVSQASAVVIVALGAFFPMWLAGLQGVASIRRTHVLAARSLGADSRILLTDVVIPSTLPAALQGLRLGVGMGWFSVVAAEMMGAPGGLGQGLQLYSMNLETAQLFAYILVIGSIGFALNAMLAAAQRRVSAWQAREGWLQV